MCRLLISAQNNHALASYGLWTCFYPEIYSLECDGHIKGDTSRHPLDYSRLCETAGKQVMTQIKNYHHLNFHRTWLGSMRRCHNSKSALGLAHTKFMQNLKNSRHTLRIQLNYVAMIMSNRKLFNHKWVPKNSYKLETSLSLTLAVRRKAVRMILERLLLVSGFHLQ
jgi:hypothetical protein